MPEQTLSSGLIVHTERKVAYRCQTPDCQRAFFEGEERNWIQHCIRCAKANEAEIREASDLGTQMPGLYDDQGGDQEYRKYQRERHGWRV